MSPIAVLKAVWSIFKIVKKLKHKGTETLEKLIDVKNIELASVFLLG